MPMELPVLKGEFFRVLANPTRIRLLEQLVPGERTVQSLHEALDLAQPIVSQQLAILRGRGVVTVRREGTQAYYRLASPLIADILRLSRAFLNGHLTEHQSMLKELRREARRA